MSNGVSNGEYLAKATAGNANIIEFAINWCALTDRAGSDPAPDPVTPAEIRARYGSSANNDTIMGRVEDRNTDGNPDNNVKVLLWAVDSPYWANGNAEHGHCEGNGGPAVTPPDLNHITYWGDFVTALLQAYGPGQTDEDGDGDAGDNYGLAAVQVWNEPNLQTFWGETAGAVPFDPDEELYARIYNEAAARMTAYRNSKGIGPADLRLLPAPLSPGGTDEAQYVQRAFDPNNGTGDYILPGTVEAINLHLYATRSPSDTRAFKNIEGDVKIVVDAYNAVADAHPGSLLSDQRWITEIGYPSTPFYDDLPGGAPAVRGFKAPANPRSQCRRLLEAWFRLAMRTDNMRAFIVHHLQDFPELVEGDPQSDDEFDFGVLPRGSVFPIASPKPAYRELKKVAAANTATYEAVDCK